MKAACKVLGKVTGAALLLALLALSTLIFQPVRTAIAQTTGYRWSGGGLIFEGLYSGIFGESSRNSGPDVGIVRIAPGEFGVVQGGVNYNPNAVLAPPPAASAAATNSGGTIAAGTYYYSLVYVTPQGGLTTQATDTTVAPSGGSSLITYTAPIAAAGAAGYGVLLSPVGGASGTEVFQPITTAVCAGAFTVQSGMTVCPFGVNAVITSATATAQATPAYNTAAYPAAIPQLICNLVPTTAVSSVTTAQTVGTCVLGAGIQNVTGKVLRVTGHLIFTSGSAGTVTVAVKEGGITAMTVTSAATAGSQTNAQADFDYYVTSSLTGASGTLEGHGRLGAQLSATLTTAVPQYNDQVTAASSAINLTAANTLTITVAAGASLTSAQLRDAQVWLLN